VNNLFDLTDQAPQSRAHRDQYIRGCSSLTSIELPAGLTSVGGRAFFDCSSLTSIALPAGLTNIGKSAFALCSSLTSIELPAGFDDRLLKSTSVPNGTTLRRASTGNVV
jgi:hypothetical protein